ncbi:MAG: M20/M25/M40 family metallo-hydrolase [Angelakisella sp.]
MNSTNNEARAQQYGRSLAKLIQCETVSSRFEESREKFLGFHKLLEEQFPLLHKTCEKHLFHGSLLFHWHGKTSVEPLLLMSHHDVVEANGDWSHDPFSGEIIDNVLWGRGTVDTKSSLFCILSAVEELLSDGFVPQTDVYIASSCTEEWSGEGAPLTAQYLKEQGVHLGMLLDEGGMIMEEPIAGVKGKFAMIGVLEKGYADVKFIAKGKGGHSSAPGKNTPLVRLAKFICEVEKHSPFTVQFNPTVREMFRRLSPSMGFGMRLIFSNLWLFGPLLKKLMPSISPAGAAMLKTTCAFTTASGASGLNVLPQTAYVTANLRFIPHQPTDESIALLADIAKKYDLETEVIYKDYPCPVVDYQGKPFLLVEDTVRELFPNCTPSPYVMTGGTDAKFYKDICENGIRFAPLEINAQQFSSIHGLNENIDLAVLPSGVDFYKTIIRKYQ